MTKHTALCHLCEATCGLLVEVEHGRVRSIRGNRHDPLSRGYVCPKGLALGRLHTDPDRVREPLRRVGDRWEPVGWDAALDEAADRLAGIARAHGHDAVGLYLGNPAAQNHATLMFAPLLLGALGTRSYYTSNSLDALPRILAAQLIFGSPARVPVPDLDRTHHLLILGSNPVISNGSIVTAPGMPRRLRALRARGARLVVVDPRRTETAALADEHHFLRPGTDALLLLAMLETLYAEDRLRPGPLAPYIDGIDELGRRTRPWTAERVAPTVGIAAPEIRRLARDLAAAPNAVCYGRLGTTVQEFGTLSSGLIDALNVLTGNLDRPGGVMFGTPPVDAAGLARLLGIRGGFDRWRSRVSGRPEFNGELPVTALAEELETPGPGQLRALVTLAGNPVLSAPNGRRLDKALAGLDFGVSIDPFVNETTRHADLILPPTVGLERPIFPLLAGLLAVRTVARFADAAVRPPPGVRHDWWILGELAQRLLARRLPGTGPALRSVGALVRGLGPERLVDLAIRLGPHGLIKGGAGTSLAAIRGTPGGADLGPLRPRLPWLLGPDRIQLAPPLLMADLARLDARYPTGAAALPPAQRGLRLIARRQRRTLNSWLHNDPELMRRAGPCTLEMHPADAQRRGLTDGDPVRVASRTGTAVTTVEVTDRVGQGVVCLPHGYGHDRPGVRLAVATRHAGVSVNDLNDDALLDGPSAGAALNGTPVTVTKLESI